MGNVPAVETEAKFVEIRLEFGAAAMVGAQKKGLEITNGFVQPLQIAIGWIKVFSITGYAYESFVTGETITLEVRSLGKMLVNKLLQGLSLKVFHYLHMRKQGNVLFRFG